MDEDILRVSPQDSLLPFFVSFFFFFSFLADVTNHGAQPVAKIRPGWLHAHTHSAHTLYCNNAFGSKVLNRVHGHLLCAALLSLFVHLPGFTHCPRPAPPGVLKTGQAPRLQMDAVELLWLKQFFFFFFY